VIESAVESPKQTFDSADLYPTVFDKASIYAFQLAEGQSFVDGNKRIGILAALTFLDINGYEVSENFEDRLYDALIAVANHQMDREGLADLFRELVVSTITGSPDEQNKE
jgi:death-on-curing protein